VVIVGSYTYLEIWDAPKYHQYIDEIEKDAENLAESLPADRQGIMDA
jgi:DNA-binding transcriptional regulator/RsmH inhibitor MraZ